MQPNWYYVTGTSKTETQLQVTQEMSVVLRASLQVVRELQAANQAKPIEDSSSLSSLSSFGERFGNWEFSLPETLLRR